MNSGHRITPEAQRQPADYHRHDPRGMSVAALTEVTEALPGNGPEIEREPTEAVTETNRST